jgi:DNA-binding SARP family transcriptional activator
MPTMAARAPDASGGDAGLAVRLLGRPGLVRAGGEPIRFRSRKSWAVLAYLLLGEAAPARARLASLLFSEADDPLRALRWSLSEIRQGLGDGATLDGDPVVLRPAPGTVVDVEVLLRGAWTDAITLAGLGAALLDGVSVAGAPGFETWLLAERHHVAAATEAALHEAALGSMARGEPDAALRYAVRAAALDPLDENHQALVIRLYRLTGDDAAAERQYAAARETFERELGVAPGVAVESALRESRQVPGEVDAATLEAIIEAGAAAVGAGSREAGVQSLRTAARLAGADRPAALRVRARLVLAEALVHALGGLDEEGLAALHEADRIALENGLPDAVAQARAELGYVDFLRGRYDRARFWLTDALDRARPGGPEGVGDVVAGSGALAVAAKATTYLGAVESDRADYPAARALLEDAVRLSRRAGDPRREAFGLSMLGRLDLLHGDLDAAAGRLDASVELAERVQWLALLPWPQALRGEVELARGDPAAAARILEQAFARACQLGDPCWEGMAARGLALVAEARGDAGRAFEVLADARVRANRLADPYVWLDAHILDAQCELGRRHGHPGTPRWVEAMTALTTRTGMRELAVRALLHAAALGDPGARSAAALLAADVDNPALARLMVTAGTATAGTAAAGTATAGTATAGTATAGTATAGTATAGTAAAGTATAGRATAGAATAGRVRTDTRPARGGS